MWGKRDTPGNKTLEERRGNVGTLFYFLRADSPTERPRRASILNQADISCFSSFMSGVSVSKHNCTGIDFDWWIKSCPLGRLLRHRIKTSRQDSGEGRTSEGVSSYSALSGLWWQRSSRDKSAPPSKAEIKTGKISLNLVPGREPWAESENTGIESTGQLVNLGEATGHACKRSYLIFTQ